MLGMDMMLKSFGIDAAEIQKMGNDALAYLSHVNARLENIERALFMVHASQRLIMDHLKIELPGAGHDAAAQIESEEK